MKTIFRRLALPVGIATGIGATATVMYSVQQDPVGYVDAQSVEAPAPVPAGAEILATSFRSASRSALPGVVHVRVEAAPRQVSQQDPFGGFPFDELLPNLPTPEPSPRTGSGSGFIISPDGYILTNNHVVENATSVTVTMTDRRSFDATVVGRDPNTDVAVLKIETDESLPTVRIGDSDVLEVGDWVLALGYPLSLGETVTAGIVSAMGKSIGIMSRNSDAVAPLEHFIQTDAAINPGNSGGPLVNLRGEVIGINTAIASPTGTYSGYGFAVPIRLAKRVADDLIEDGVVHRPRIGVEVRNVVPDDIEVLGLPGLDGALVGAVQDGPAKDAGVRAGDVIVAIEGQAIREAGELTENLALRRPGDRVTIEVLRDGDDRLRIPVTLGEFATEPAPTSARASRPARDAVAQLGFAASELTPALARQLEITDAQEGVVITRIERGGPAPETLLGLRIRSVNGQPVGDIDDLRDIADRLEPGQVISIVGVTPSGDERMVNYRTR